MMAFLIITFDRRLGVDKNLPILGHGVRFLSHLGHQAKPRMGPSIATPAKTTSPITAIVTVRVL